MTYIAHRRWSDNDTYFGPLTISLDRRYRSSAIVLCSGDDEYPGASLRLTISGATVILALPAWLVPPEKAKVYPRWDAETVTRLGRDWYWDIKRRQYGLSLNEGLFTIYYGRQTHDSSTEQTWSKFLPWTQWRHVRHDLYGHDGAFFAHVPESGYRLGAGSWEDRQRVVDSCPTAAFAFNDFDGEALTATTKIEEREWRLGEGAFKWLSAFARPKVRRSLDIDFSKETGRRKGSWKGGTTGHSIEMKPGELHEAAFKRYCAEHEMTFSGPA